MTLPVRSRPRAVAGWDPFRELDELTQRVNSLWDANLNGDLPLRRFHQFATCDGKRR